MPIEIDDNSIRIIGNDVEGIKFYDDDRTLRQSLSLNSDNELSISGTLETPTMDGDSVWQSATGVPVDIDTDGITIWTSGRNLNYIKYKFNDAGTARTQASMYAVYNSAYKAGEFWVTSMRPVGSPWTHSVLYLTAYDYEAGEGARLTLTTKDGPRVIMTDAAITTGLYVGRDAMIADCTDTAAGIVVDQIAADGSAVVLKAWAVDHPMTAQSETDTYARFQKAETLGGGLSIQGFKGAYGAAGNALLFSGRLGEAADTTKSTAGIGVIVLNAQVTDGGTGTQAVGADGNLLAIRTYTTTRFLFDAEGSAHADVEWTTFDEHDDAALLDNLETTLTDWQRNPVKAEFGQWLTEEAAQLEALGIVHFDRDNPGHAMVNTTRLSMLLVGALRQMSARLNALGA